VSERRIAILGFGFSGLMVAATLVREAVEGTLLYIIADDLSALGLAYGTVDLDHLLNVPAGKMGAFADTIDGFLKWLTSYDGAQAKQQLEIAVAYGAEDFVPRALYGRYLQSIWRDTQALAQKRGILLKLVEARATYIRRDNALAILTERGDAIAVDRIVLATGHEVKPILPHVTAPYIVQDPWAKEAFAGAAEWAAPVALMGVGLTAVDVVMRLRNLGYKGEIIAFSRHGLLPQPHRSGLGAYSWNQTELFAQQNLQQLVRYVRSKVTQHQAAGGDWREVIDALRPHTQTLWQKLTLRDQQRFLTRLLSFWNVHRHRMAPEIAARIQAEITKGGLRIIASKQYRVLMEEGRITLALHAEGAEHLFYPSRIINCTGPQMDVTRSAKTLLRQAVADHVIEPHATTLGIAVDPNHRAWGTAYPALYVVGPLMTGQLLESTAVPELRIQAAQVAACILDS
jgi:uncharacterized NAD(P)/FAD-binding protein YdhS